MLHGTKHLLRTISWFSLLATVAYPLIRLSWHPRERFSPTPVQQVYPRIIGGLGNQLFMISAAAIVADGVQGSVVLNSRQTGVYSYGSPQPVFWRSIFHSDKFLYKDFEDSKLRVTRFSEIDFRDGLSVGFDRWRVKGNDLYLDDPFLSFDYFVNYREFLRDLYKPSAEVQRIVNDAAVKLGVAPAKDIPPCEYPPAACDDPVYPLSCLTPGCEENIAVQVRLSDHSTPWNFLDQTQALAVGNFVLRKLEGDKNVVLFSNDPSRALLALGLQSLSKKHASRVKVAGQLNYVEFFLMSQYFGTHILTGSTFQLWAVFLSHLRGINVVVLHGNPAPVNDGVGTGQVAEDPRRPGTVDDLGFQTTFEHFSHMRFEILEV